MIILEKEMSIVVISDFSLVILSCGVSLSVMGYLFVQVYLYGMINQIMSNMQRMVWYLKGI